MGSSAVDKAQFGTHAGLPDSDAESLRETYEIRLHPTPGETLARIGAASSPSVSAWRCCSTS
jgi:hypothetical protein